MIDWTKYWTSMVSERTKSEMGFEMDKMKIRTLDLDSKLIESKTGHKFDNIWTYTQEK